MHFGLGVDSASSKTEYMKSSWGKRLPVRKAGLCEPTV
jgi:hypothetical protein